MKLNRHGYCNKCGAKKQEIFFTRTNNKGQFSKIISVNEEYRLRCVAITFQKPL